MIVFLFYITVIAGTFALAALIADLWLAHDQRKERDQARAEARAKRMEARGSSGSW